MILGQLLLRLLWRTILEIRLLDILGKSHWRIFFHWKRTKIQRQISEKEWQDLIDFEGNANGFSVLTSSRKESKVGLVLIRTLGAFMKYPKESLPKKPTQNIADKKYGFFQSDKPFFKEVASEMGMIANKSAMISVMKDIL